MTVTDSETCSRNKGKAITGEENWDELISVQNSPELKRDLGKDAIEDSWDLVLTQSREQARTLQDGLLMDKVLGRDSNTENQVQAQLFWSIDVLKRLTVN